MTEIARVLVPVTSTMISGRPYVLIDRTAPTYVARDPNTLWVAAGR